jgi:hypothetical protein
VSGPETSPLARARAAALAELRAAPVAVPWSREAAWVAVALAGVSALAALAAIAVGVARPADVIAAAPTIGALLVLALVGGVAVVAPPAAGGKALQAFTLAAASFVMAALALGRRAGLPTETPAWVCSASHFGLGLVPLALALRALRRSAWSWPRALAAGVGAGTAGALLGELACHRGALHVLAHHVGAWVSIILVGVVVSRWRRPRSYAP